MSYERLQELEASRAFEGTRRFEDLGFYHVAFDELNGDKNTESTLCRLVGNRGRVAVVGPSGSGKSSVIASVFGPLSMELPENFIPLRIPVAAEVDEVVTEPGALARHIVRYVTRWASPERFSAAEHRHLRMELQRSIEEQPTGERASITLASRCGWPTRSLPGRYRAPAVTSRFEDQARTPSSTSRGWCLCSSRTSSSQYSSSTIPTPGSGLLDWIVWTQPQRFS